MAWDYETLLRAIWASQKARDPRGWFLEPPAAYFFGKNLQDIEAQAPSVWREVIRVHRARWPEAFEVAGARAKGALMVCFRPEGMGLLPIGAPFLEGRLPRPTRVARGPEAGAYPPIEPKLHTPLVLDPAPVGDELDVHPLWLMAQGTAFAYTTCANPEMGAIAAVFDPGPEPEARLSRLVFLQGHVASYPDASPATQRLAKALREHREALQRLPAVHGPYFLVPMRTGLLFVGQAGNALPVLLGDEADYRALLARAVPEGWGPVLGLLPFDREARPLEDAATWARALAERSGVRLEDLMAWVEQARREAKVAGRGGAFVVAKRVSGFVASPVLWRRPR